MKWGSAKANYLLLSNQGYLSRAQSLGVAMGIAIPLGAVIGGYATYAGRNVSSGQYNKTCGSYDECE